MTAGPTTAEKTTQAYCPYCGAATRARDLLLMPDQAQRLTPPAWIKAVQFPLDGLDPFVHTEWLAEDVLPPPAEMN